MPTGVILPADMVRLTIEEFAVHPRRPDWATVLRFGRKDFDIDCLAVSEMKPFHFCKGNGDDVVVILPDERAANHCNTSPRKDPAGRNDSRILFVRLPPLPITM